MDNYYSVQKRENTGINTGLAAKKQNLSTRKRVNFVLSNAIIEKLQKKSREDQVPMSRIIDAALSNYFASPNPQTTAVSLKTGIVLYHTFEVIIGASTESNIVKNVSSVAKRTFENYTYSSCILRDNPAKVATVGTKIMLFLSDDKTEKLNTFLNEVTKLRERQLVKVFLDSKEIGF